MWGAVGGGVGSRRVGCGELLSGHGRPRRVGVVASVRGNSSPWATHQEQPSPGGVRCWSQPHRTTIRARVGCSGLCLSARVIAPSSNHCWVGQVFDRPGFSPRPIRGRLRPVWWWVKGRAAVAQRRVCAGPPKAGGGPRANPPLRRHHTGRDHRHIGRGVASLKVGALFDGDVLRAVVSVRFGRIGHVMVVETGEHEMNSEWDDPDEHWLED